MSKKEKLGELITENKENAEELDDADIKVASDKDTIEKNISKLILENKHTSNKLDAAYKIIATQEKEIKKQAEAIIRADKEKEKRKADLISAKKELAHRAELAIANKELNQQITKRKKAEEVVNLQKIKLELALQSSQMGTWELNIVENKLIFDNQVCFLLGIDSATYGETTEEFFSVVHPNDLEKVKGALKKTVEQDAFYKPEYRVIWQDGSIHHISARGNLLHDDKGNPQMISGIIWDNTENKKKEEALKNSEAKHSSMISNISDVIGILGLDGFMKYKSPNVEKWFGWQPQDLVGYDGFSTVHPDDLERIQQEFVTILEKENFTTKAEFRYKCKDGSYKPVEVNAINLTNDPLINGILMNYRDITERKQAESELIKAKEKAEESDRLKSAFLANMSHEIRTPMNGILGFSELLKKPNLSGEEQQKYIRVIEKSGKRMLNIINDIVNISKIEAGLINVDIKESNINEQIEYIYTFFKPEVEAKGMQLFFKNTLPVKEATINTDREKLFAILTNLIKNAIKYSVEGSIEFGYVLKMGSEIIDQSRNAELEFFVKDTGIGIPKDRQEDVFERFIQADIMDTMARQGAGLGLSISKAYIEMLGGEIWVESEEDIGSTFYFTLPYNAVLKEKKIEITPEVSDNTKNHIKNLKILIVEDDETSEMLLEIMVNSFGKEIIKARTGIETIETCRNNPDIDLILMDIQMPEMNGYEATRQIRKFNKEVVIIAQTAYGLSGDREKAITAGCNDYISKPIKKDHLAALIQKHFKK